VGRIVLRSYCASTCSLFYYGRATGAFTHILLKIKSSVINSDLTAFSANSGFYSKGCCLTARDYTGKMFQVESIDNHIQTIRHTSHA
jgi:hypothetical protein